MARVRVTVYKKSFVATLLSFLGTATMMFGGIFLCASIFDMMEGNFGRENIEFILCGLTIAVIGVSVSVLAGVVNRKKAFEEWREKVKAENLESVIQESVDVALKLYQENQIPEMKKYLISLNPAAAAAIAEYEKLHNAKISE